MNVKRFIGRTNREAMAKLRAELGPDAIVLRNRVVDGGVEVLAMAEDDGRSNPARALESAPVAEPVQPRAPARPSMPVEDDDADEWPEAALPEMSTVSFQQYVRERLAQKLAGATLAEVVRPEPARESRAPGQRSMADLAPTAPAARPAQRIAAPAQAAPAQVAPAQAAAAQVAAAQVATAPAASAQAPAVADPGEPAASQDQPRAARQAAAQPNLLHELREMRSFIAEQLGSLAFFDGARRSPLQGRLLRQMLSAGFSPALARAVVSRVPSDFADRQADIWLRAALARNLRCLPGDRLMDEGGVYALVGPTGVGKTTSAAKIAARFALRHGVQSVGLITVDAYRIGAKDQLRAYGRMLGVPVHVAHDAATLADFLHLFAGKKLVLIDTAGIGQRDERVDELLASLSSVEIRKLVVMSAAAQAETLEDVALAYRAADAAGVVVSKLDEAVKLGGVIDCAIRHRLSLVGISDGQRVPEDWRPPVAGTLVDKALSVQTRAAFDFDDGELGMMFMSTAQAADAARGVHA